VRERVPAPSRRRRLLTALPGRARHPGARSVRTSSGDVDTFILIELARGEHLEENRLRAALAHRPDGRISLLALRARLHGLSSRGLVLLEGRRRSTVLRTGRLSITRAGRAVLAAHARALDLLTEEIHVALLGEEPTH